jgi:UDP-glucose 4-epimerase
MRILITGGIGYLGGRLGQHLGSNKENTILLGTRSNISSVDWLPDAKIILTPWHSNAELEKICSGVDVVIHSAGMNSMDCLKNPQLAFEVNGLATERLLQSSINQKVNRFIYISTAHIYDSPLIGKINEQSPVKNLHPYSTSHKAGEDSVLLAHAKGEIEGVVVRLSNSFGAPTNLNTNCWQLITNELCKHGIKYGNMVINNSEMQKRDFVSIHNVCRAIKHLIDLPISHLDNGLFNLGGEWTPTLLEVAEILAERIYLLLGIKININTPNLNEDYKSPSLDYDISKLKSTNFKLTNDRNKEYDNLVQFCNVSFGD